MISSHSNRNNCIVLWELSTSLIETKGIKMKDGDTSNNSDKNVMEKKKTKKIKKKTKNKKQNKNKTKTY